MALKGPNLAQMAKYLSRDLESQKRPLFLTVLVTENRFCIKRPNIASKRPHLAHFGQNWVKIDPKWPKIDLAAVSSKKDHFSTQFKKLSKNITQKFQLPSI